jgi:replication factor A1
MMDETELAPYVEDLTWALENNIDSKEIETELKNLINNYTLPVDEAKRCVLKKFGGDVRQLGNVIDRTISELNKSETNINLLCKIIFIGEKEVNVDGQPKRITYGILGDATGTVSFTAWHEFGFDKDQVVRIYNAYIRTWRDKVQVNLGDRTHVRLVPAETLPDVKMTGVSELIECQVKDFRSDMRNIKITLRILDISEHEITVKGEPVKLHRGLGSDETGICRFAAWSEFDLNIGDVVTITNAYLRSWRGVPELQLNGNTSIERLSDEILPSLEILSKARIVPIRDLKRSGGAVGIALEGIVLDIRSNSGLIKRCPDCRRVLQDDACMVHGKVNGEFDLRVKCILDDGSGSVNVVLNKEITERILGLDLEGCISKVKEHLRFDIIYEDLIKKLVARPIRISGTVVSDDYGLMMIGTNAEIISPKIKTEAVSLLNELGIEIENEVWDNENQL